ncbi:MAG: AAA family ATPase [Candidatus Dormibacteraeota bacterium]|uniref:AAA family ATPase n=1 Tax=Candidatus Amunia macphersoniae TaxID=3127014 RepID=A0A934KMG5_9BACT|nr:AAA family ATPase [Candidatus Dormibacteraeota bacterium]
MAASSTVIGHETVRGRLLTAHRDGRLGHAVLLTGPSGVGKTALACDFASAVLDASRWPGGLLAHPDLWLEDSDAERIGIDRVRPGAPAETGPSLQDAMSLRTYAGGARIAVMARAERLTEQAADALLKTLEEPPPDTVIVLCAANPDALPATILSRAQHIGVGRVGVPRISAWLEEQGLEARLAGLAAALSGGRPGRAKRLATQPGALSAEIEALHSFLAVAGAGMEGALRAATELTPGAGADGRERAMLLLSVWASFVRDAMCEAEAVPEMRLWKDYADPLKRWAESLGAARLTEILGLLMRASGDISRYAQPRLTFETLFLDIFSGPDAPPPVVAPSLPLALADAPAAPATTRAPRPATGRSAKRR